MSQGQIKSIQRSHLVYGSRLYSCVSLYEDDNGIIWLRQNGQECTLESWEAGNEDFRTSAKMDAEIHAVTDKWID